MSTTRRGFLGALLALAVAPNVAGFRPTPLAQALAPGRFVSVLDFGATTHPLADNTDAFQAAIDAAARTGRSVYVPAGTYYMGPPAIVRSVPRVRA